MGRKKKYINIFGSFTEPFNSKVFERLSSNFQGRLCLWQSRWKYVMFFSSMCKTNWSKKRL